jgi:homoserine O-acetyltransferase
MAASKNLIQSRHQDVRPRRFRKIVKKPLIAACMLLHLFVFSGHGQEQKFAALGDYKLENGDVIHDLTLGYRTFGTMNPDRSNIVLYLTWAGGRTSQLNLKPSDAGKLIDTNKYFVVAIDALSNGVSSSPSNSKLQPRMKFPQYNFRDLINAEHLFLNKALGIDHVRAITGASMGGMQTFQWVVSYPNFMDKAIPIVGSPQLAAYDLLHWQTQISAIMNDPGWMNGNYTMNPAREFEYEIGALILTTPDEYNRKTTRDQALSQIAKARQETGGFDANDKIRQTQAMMSLDVTEKFGGSWEKAAASVKAKTLIIVARTDHTVTPQPAMTFAAALNVKPLILESDCGHMAPTCELERVNAAVAEFLDH